MLSRFHNRKGFTLIELMIVVVIIGILAALAIPRFMQTSGKAKKSEAKTVLKQLYQLERAYFQEFDAYVAGANTAALVASSLSFDDPGADARYDYSLLWPARPLRRPPLKSPMQMVTELPMRR